MHLNKNLKIRSSCFVIAILVVYLSLSAFTPVNLSVAQMDESYTYCGVVPSKIYLYILNDWNVGPPNDWMNLSSGWTIGTVYSDYLGGSLALNGSTAPSAPQIATKSLLAIVAGENDTNVEVYNLTLNSWMQVWAGSLNSMEKQLLLLDNGTTFKVVSDKIVSVLLLNYQGFPSASVMEGPVPCTSYTDVNGLYVGKEFVFMASENPGAVQSGSQKGEGTGAFYTILALESGTVTVTSESGQVVWQGSLDANGFKYLVLMPFTVYKIESTGNIMVQSGAVLGLSGESFPCYAIPSADGGFVGQHFFAPSLHNQAWGWDPVMYYGYQISALETAHVTIYDLSTQTVMETLTIPGGTAVVTQPDSYAIRVDSDEPITMSLISNGSIIETPTDNGDKYQAYPNGLIFIGIRPNQETMIYLPTEGHDEAYFFASNQTQLTIDGTAYTIPAGSSYFYSLPGTHTVESNSSVILQINFWPSTPENQGLWYSGAVIPCIETVDSSAPVTLTPIAGGFPMMYVFVGVGAAVVVVVVVVGVLVMRRRDGTSTT